jgi:hypothetical protein
MITMMACEVFVVVVLALADRGAHTQNTVIYTAGTSHSKGVLISVMVAAAA